MLLSSQVSTRHIISRSNWLMVNKICEVLLYKLRILRKPILIPLWFFVISQLVFILLIFLSEA